MLKSVAAIANAIRTAVGGLLQIVGPSSGTTRTMTVPDANFTVARTDAAQTFTGVQTFSDGIISAVFTTARGEQSAASGSPTTLYTLGSGFGTFIVSIGFNGYGSAANYSAVSIINVDAGTTKKTDLVTSANMSIGLSGLNVQGTQSSGNTLSISYSIVKIQ